MTKISKDELNQRVADALKEANVSETKEAQYSDVKFSKPCPKCGQYELLRYVDAFAGKSDAPIMPLYHCNNCNTKSHHLTNEYLEYLVENNAALFDDKETSELSKDRSAFMTELKGYIIRIFASKKIMSIE